MSDPVEAAMAIVAGAHLNELTREYSSVPLPRLRDVNAYDKNPLRQKMNVICRVITSPRSRSSAECEFRVVSLVGRNREILRCVAQARAAVHIRCTDTIEMTGTLVNGEFKVDCISAAS